MIIEKKQTENKKEKLLMIFASLSPCRQQISFALLQERKSGLKINFLNHNKYNCKQLNCEPENAYLIQDSVLLSVLLLLLLLMFVTQK
jgi:hypothetical protein